MPLPEETGTPVYRHRLAHPAGHLAIARLSEAGEALERARRRILGLTDPHSAAAHAIAEAALTQAHTGAPALAPDAAPDNASDAAPDAVPKAAHHGVPDRAVSTMAVANTAAWSYAEAGLLSCARVAFDALDVEHGIVPLESRQHPSER